jgi:hypothetical protein
MALRKIQDREGPSNRCIAIDVQLGTPVQDLCAQKKWW